MFYWPNIRKFQCWKEEKSEGEGEKEEGGEVEGKVSYSVSGDLNNYLKKYHMISLKTWF